MLTRGGCVAGAKAIYQIQYKKELSKGTSPIEFHLPFVSLPMRSYLRKDAPRTTHA
nr:hypothetical protein Q903MT_gene1142 [Picea sitchensis]